MSAPLNPAFGVYVTVPSLFCSSPPFVGGTVMFTVVIPIVLPDSVSFAVTVVITRVSSSVESVSSTAIGGSLISLIVIDTSAVSVALSSSATEYVYESAPLNPAFGV